MECYKLLSLESVVVVVVSVVWAPATEPSLSLFSAAGPPVFPDIL